MGKLLHNPEQMKLCMADLQQHFILHRKDTALVTANAVEDITGSELKRIIENLEKQDKPEKEDKPEENNPAKPAESAPWTLSPSLKYPLYGIGAGVTAGLALGSAIIISSLLKVK